MHKYIAYTLIYAYILNKNNIHITYIFSQYELNSKTLKQCQFEKSARRTDQAKTLDCGSLSFGSVGAQFQLKVVQYSTYKLIPARYNSMQ